MVRATLQTMACMLLSIPLHIQAFFVPQPQHFPTPLEKHLSTTAHHSACHPAGHGVHVAVNTSVPQPQHFLNPLKPTSSLRLTIVRATRRAMACMLRCGRLPCEAVRARCTHTSVAATVSSSV